MNTVYERLASEKPRLLEKLGTNTDLCNFVLGLLGRIVIMATQRGIPRSGVTLGPLAQELRINGDLSIRSKVSFNRLVVNAPAMWTLQSDFAKYAQAKARGLGLALQENPKVAASFQDLLEVVERWAEDKGLPFRDVKVKQAIISNPGDMLVLKVGKDILDTRSN